MQKDRFPVSCFELVGVCHGKLAFHWPVPNDNGRRWGFGLILKNTRLTLTMNTQ